MDAKIRFLLACQITETRFVEDAQIPLRLAKAAANIKPDVILSQMD
jgi:hypothetical protein